MTSLERYEANEKLITYCVRGFQFPAEYLEDARAEARLGLWEACVKFDESLGYSFSTYAVPMIHGKLLRFCRDFIPGIRFPRSMYENGTWKQVGKVSLDSTIQDTEGDSAAIENWLVSSDDEYEFITIDLIESFLDTIKDKKSRDIFEEYLYGSVYGEPPSQLFLAKKYQTSQPSVSRIIKRLTGDFREFYLNVNFKGGDEVDG